MTKKFHLKHPLDNRRSLCMSIITTRLTDDFKEVTCNHCRYKIHRGVV
jgi:hypothetical protein